MACTGALAAGHQWGPWHLADTVDLHRMRRSPCCRVRVRGCSGKLPATLFGVCASCNRVVMEFDVAGNRMRCCVVAPAPAQGAKEALPFG